MLQILNVTNNKPDILDALHIANKMPRQETNQHFGQGGARQAFGRIIRDSEFWNCNVEKQFQDIGASLLNVEHYA